MIKRLITVKDNVLHNFSTRRLIAMLLGNLILGVGCAGLKLSLMGNDSFNAAMMAFSEAFGVGQGNLQFAINAVLMICEILWGYQYIGLGTLVNMGILGYIVQYSAPVLAMTVGGCEGHSLAYCLVYMLVSLLVVSFGLSMYQKADMGVAPYDYLSIGLTDHFHRPYFFNRIAVDATCVLMIVAAALLGVFTWGNSHLGIGTVLGAFCLGPFVSLFDRVNRKWIH